MVAESLSGRPNRGAADRVLDAGTKGWLVLTLAATWVGASLVADFVPGAAMPGTPVIPVVGAIVALSGIAFRAWASITFCWIAAAVMLPPALLVTGGFAAAAILLH